MAHKEKAFVYLYPEVDVLDFEIQRKAGLPKGENLKWRKRYDAATSDPDRKRIGTEWKKAGHEYFRERYSQVLNSCIDVRYRKNDFEIVYALLKFNYYRIIRTG